MQNNILSKLDSSILNELKKDRKFLQNPAWEDFLHNFGLSLDKSSEKTFLKAFFLNDSTDHLYPSNANDKVQKDNIFTHQKNPEIYSFLQKYQKLADDCINKSIDRRSLGAFVITGQNHQKRDRLPIHIHRGIALDKFVGLTVSFCFKVRESTSVNSSFNFYQSTSEINLGDSNIDSRLVTVEPELSIPIDSLVSVFIFDSTRIPHTVIFGDDLCLFYIISNVGFNGPIFKSQGPVYSEKY